MATLIKNWAHQIANRNDFPSQGQNRMNFCRKSAIWARNSQNEIAIASDGDSQFEIAVFLCLRLCRKLLVISGPRWKFAIATFRYTQSKKQSITWNNTFNERGLWPYPLAIRPVCRLCCSHNIDFDAWDGASQPAWRPEGPKCFNPEAVKATSALQGQPHHTVATSQISHFPQQICCNLCCAPTVNSFALRHGAHLHCKNMWSAHCTSDKSEGQVKWMIWHWSADLPSLHYWAAPGVLWKKTPRAMRAMRGNDLETIPFQPYVGCTESFLEVLSNRRFQARRSMRAKEPYFGFHWITLCWAMKPWASHHAGFQNYNLPCGIEIGSSRPSSKALPGFCSAGIWQAHGDNTTSLSTSHWKAELWKDGSNLWLVWGDMADDLMKGVWIQERTWAKHLQLVLAQEDVFTREGSKRFAYARVPEPLALLSSPSLQESCESWLKDATAHCT